MYTPRNRSFPSRRNSASQVDGGAGLVEFAIVLPLILVLAAGLINLGILIWQVILVLEWGRAAGRVGSIFDQRAAVEDITDRDRATCTEIHTEISARNTGFNERSKAHTSQWEAPDVNSTSSLCSSWDGAHFRFTRVRQTIKADTSCTFCFANILKSFSPTFEVTSMSEREECQSPTCS